MKIKLTQKQLRELIAKTYWQGHEDGRLCGKNGKPNFGLAAITIENNSVVAGCNRTRAKVTVAGQGVQGR